MYPKTRSFGCTLSAWVGLAEDDRELKASESMTAIEDAIRAAIGEMGWDYNTEGHEYNFYLQHVWEGDCVVVDTDTGKYYKISYTMNDGVASLGVPEETDISFGSPETSEEGGEETPPATEEPEPAGASRKHGHSRVKFNSTRVEAVAATDPHKVKEKRPIFKVLICSSGFTADGRYIKRKALEKAVANGVFDNVRCFWGHPKKDSGGYREEPPIGFVKAGTATIQPNKAGEVDAFAYIVLFRPDKHPKAAMMEEILQASLDEGAALTRNSFYGDVVQGYEEIGGRTVLAWDEILGADAIDFVDAPAVLRAGVVGRVAASKQPSSTEGTLTMTEKERLEKLEADLTEIKKSQTESAKTAASAERAEKVQAMLDKTTLPAYIKLMIKGQMAKVENLDLVQAEAEITALAQAHVAELKQPPTGNVTGKDTPPSGGDGDDDGLSKLSKETRDRVMTAAANMKVTPEQMKAAAAQQL